MSEKVGFKPTVPVPLTVHTFQVCTVNLGIVNQHLFNVQILKIVSKCDQRASRFVSGFSVVC